ncbi:hypothetical protein HHK36_000105 [Tetracentron sinense]|uniref:Phytocyanin domain-containing protein n=1 Tax=Tetracentron sinense TaxID=13715 RepID=A0A834ZR25_TETSI|nr:hypothetical protein HHK36_000105 [Tetracentron sinense]
MAQMYISLFLLAAMGCLMMGRVSAMNHIVGGSFGWIIPKNLSFYQEWAKPRTFGVGDKLVFLYRTGVHNVLQVNEKDFNACTQKEVIDMLYSGPTIMNLTEPGDYYYYCGVGTHCEAGQKLAITVTTAEGSSGTPFVLDTASANITSNGSTSTNTTNIKSSANSVHKIGVVSGLLSFFLSLLI